MTAIPADAELRENITVHTTCITITEKKIYYYYFKLLNLFRQQLAYSNENFSHHIYCFIVVIIVAGMKMQT